ncbi:unnamed protein product [Phytophthora lilii]|uniref:Unnamed protein product n=1 Tax=Phytophthora lilii TaxID=2077276 RepID=A0A9W6XDS5_9STRA|nr:unnamed protein product [Phytophthora lilii]
MTIASLDDEVKQAPEHAAGAAVDGIGVLDGGGAGGGGEQARAPALAIEPFIGKELYKEMGAGFVTWGRRFLRQIRISEELSRVTWPEDVKLDVLGRYLRPTVTSVARSTHGIWITQPVWYAMDQMNTTFGANVSKTRDLWIFTAKKDTSMTWNDLWLYLLANSEAVGGANDLVLENIAKYASPEECMQAVLLARYNPNRTEYLRQAKALVQFAQPVDHGITRAQTNPRLLQLAHLKRNCPGKSKAVFVLAVADGLIGAARGSLTVGLATTSYARQSNLLTLFLSMKAASYHTAATYSVSKVSRSSPCWWMVKEAYSGCMTLTTPTTYRGISFHMGNFRNVGTSSDTKETFVHSLGAATAQGF